MLVAWAKTVPFLFALLMLMLVPWVTAVISMKENCLPEAVSVYAVKATSPAASTLAPGTGV